MPNSIEQFVPWRILQYVKTRLEVELGQHGGYNTQPLVTLDYEAWRNSTVDCALFIDSPDLRITEHYIGDGSTGATRGVPEVVLTIYGSVKTKLDQPQRAMMALLQDTLTLLSVHPKDMRAAIGCGVTMRVQSADTATFNLTGLVESVFNLEVVYSYQQGSTW